MKLKQNPARSLFLLLLLGSAAAIPGQAQYNPFLLEESRGDNTRAMRGEFYLLGQYFTAESSVIENVTLATLPPGSFATSDLKFDFEADDLWGFGFAYHINNHFAVRAEFTAGYPDYEASWNGETLRGESFVQEGRFNLDYHLLEGPLTPYVSGGLGYFYVDTGIPSGPPEYYYWWDYYWGYVVSVNQPTHEETFFTLNAAVGLRWDVSDEFFIKLEGTAEWIELSSDQWIQSMRASLAAGWKF
jgi:opacity protein-like surface antigen